MLERPFLFQGENMATKLLFVCLGNICRSPAAENIMNHLVQNAGMAAGEVICDSAGTNSYHIGNPPDRRMQAAGKERSIPMVGKARSFTAADFEKFDLILAMDKANYQDIRSLDPQGKYAAKVQMMCTYASQHSEQEVPDPYYGGDAGFTQVIDLLLDACGGLLASIEK
jgi:protein-tyrosine phosphatase